MGAVRDNAHLSSLRFLLTILDIIVELWNISRSLTSAKKVLLKVVCHTPEEVLVHVAEAVTLAWEKEHIEALVVAD